MRIKKIKKENKPSHRIPKMLRAWLQTMNKEGWECIHEAKEYFYFKRTNDTGFPNYFTPQWFDELNNAIEDTPVER